MERCYHDESRTIGRLTPNQGFIHPGNNLIAGDVLVYCPTCDRAAWNKLGVRVMVYDPPTTQQREWIAWADAGYPA